MGREEAHGRDCETTSGLGPVEGEDPPRAREGGGKTGLRRRDWPAVCRPLPGRSIKPALVVDEALGASQTALVQRWGQSEKWVE